MVVFVIGWYFNKPLTDILLIANHIYPQVRIWLSISDIFFWIILSLKFVYIMRNYLQNLVLSLNISCYTDDNPQFCLSMFGKLQLCLGAYRYCKATEKGPTVRWRCTKQPRGCRPKIITLNSRVICQRGVHNHWNVCTMLWIIKQGFSNIDFVWSDFVFERLVLSPSCGNSV